MDLRTEPEATSFNNLFFVPSVKIHIVERIDSENVERSHDEISFINMVLAAFKLVDNVLDKCSSKEAWEK